MSIIPRNSFLDLDALLDRFLAPANTQNDNKNAFFTPRIDIKDKGDKYEITAELPGVNKEDIHITLDNGVLSIEAESKQEDKEEKDGKIIRQERRYGRFVRSFTVGNGLQEKDIDASFKNGVLHLTAPKAQAAQESARRITIN